MFEWLKRQRPVPPIFSNKVVSQYIEPLSLAEAICVQHLGEKVHAKFATDEKFFGEFERKCAAARVQWQAYEVSRTASLPPPMIYIVWEEITRLTKEIAVCSQFTSDPEKFLPSLVDSLRREYGPEPVGNLDLTVREILDQIEKAKDPNDLTDTGSPQEVKR